MRETFPREAAGNPEPFTGERLTASVHGRIEDEHYHRYLYARGFCRERDVLDVACGEGYGAAQLAQVARRVVGVEYAGATAGNAAANFPRANLAFLRADARCLPLAEASFDVVTSFETIEHFDRQDQFLAEVRRVLRPDGCFIVSTPDEAVREPGAADNPFHVLELDRAGFLALLHQHFRYVSLIRQRHFVASALIPEETAAISPLIFERTADTVFAVDTALPKAPYLIAIASEFAPRLAPVSLLIDRTDIDVKQDVADIRIMEQEAEPGLPRIAEAAARDAAETTREALELALRDAKAEREAARQAVEQAWADAQAAAVTLTHTRAALVQANTDLDRVSHSALHFLRQYVPRLWGYLVR